MYVCLYVYTCMSLSLSLYRVQCPLQDSALRGLGSAVCQPWLVMIVYIYVYIYIYIYT